MKKKIMIIVLAVLIVLLGAFLIFFLKDSNVTKAEITEKLPAENYSYSSIYDDGKILFENYTFKDSSTFKKELHSSFFKKLSKSSISSLQEKFRQIDFKVSSNTFTASLNDYVDYENTLVSGDYYAFSGSIDGQFTLYYYSSVGDSLYIISSK